MDPLDQVGDPSKGQYGVLKIQTSPLGNESASGNTELNGKNYNLFLVRRITFICGNKSIVFIFRNKSVFAILIQ